MNNLDQTTELTVSHSRKFQHLGRMVKFKLNEINQIDQSFNHLMKVLFICDLIYVSQAASKVGGQRESALRWCRQT
ncbi:hypothetical protein [Granulicella sp. dw_53]|uniref:hypothetical protein n=1 Tax=Granulicella sp. dw_53 TaxID=2719792 RepID=UPI001BD3F43F|nr:hypothetical protein [Granulicella sp. dw_53]